MPDEEDASELPEPEPDSTGPAQLKVSGENSNKRPARDPYRPKRAKSAFSSFAEATRKELESAVPDMEPGMLTKLLGQEWRKLTDEDKAPYTALAATDLERYEKEMRVYESRFGTPQEDDDEDFDGDFEAEITSLKRKLVTARDTIKVQAKEIEELKAAKKAKAEKAGGKAAEKAAAAGGEGAASSKDAGSSSKAAASKSEKAGYPEDDAHYVEWCTKVVGESGEKMDEELRTAFEDDGEDALVKLLAKRYKKEHAASA